MPRHLTVRVTRATSGSQLQKIIPVEDVDIEIRSSILVGVIWNRVSAVTRTTLVENDADGVISVEIPDLFTAPTANGPVRIRASAPGYVSSGWITIEDTGDVSRYIALQPVAVLGEWELADVGPYIRFEDWSFNARVRAVVDFQGRRIDEDRRGLEGSLRYDRHDDEMTIISLPDVPVTVMPGLSGTVRIETPVTGPFDYSTGQASLNLRGVVEVNSPFLATSTVDVTVSTQNSFADINMSGLAKTDSRIRLAGMGGVFERRVAQLPDILGDHLEPS